MPSITEVTLIPAEMSKFSDRNLQLVHDTVKETRHKLAAHFDRKHSERMFRDGGLHLPPSEVRFDLRADAFAVSSNAASLNPEFVHSVRALCAYQIERLSARLGAFAEILRKEKRIGEFVFIVE